MNRLLPLIILVCSAATVCLAGNVQVGRHMPAYTLPDQWNNQHTLTTETNAIVMSFEMDLSKMLNNWLVAKGEDVLTANNIHYVSDIAPMPAPITKLFALPKMQSYKHQMLLNRDEDFHKDFPVKAGKVMVIKLNRANRIREIVYVATINELEKELGLD